MTNPTQEPKPESAEEQREQVLENERKANEKQPKNFKDDAVTEKVIDLGPIDPNDGNIDDLDPPGAGTR